MSEEQAYEHGEWPTRGGPILIVMATAFFFVMLGAAAMTIDIGNGMLQQRRLQNATDAAALAAAGDLSRGGTVTTATAAANSVVSSNTGGALTIPDPPVGSGTSLSQGIEISGGSVRVALSRQVNTFLAGAVGVKTLTISAHSRAGTSYQGVLPVAVKRFSAGDTSYDLGTGSNPSSVVDYLATASSAQISTWPSPLTTSAASPAGYTAPNSYNSGVSGPVIPFVGQNSLANVANGNDFHFWVAPDVRQITSATPQYYNGVLPTTSVQQLKDLESTYFYDPNNQLSGYPGEPPNVGEQLAAMNGTNTSQTVDAIRKSFSRGSIVTAMVYDGTVYRKPDFSLQLDQPVKSSPNIGPGPNPASQPITFNVTIVPVNNFTGNVTLSAEGLDGWADWKFASASPNSSYTIPVSGSSVTVPVKVSSSSVVSGARTVQIEGVGSGLPRTAAATVVVGSNDVYSVSTASSYQVVEQGSFTRFDLTLEGWNGYGPTDVSVGSPQWPDGTPAGVSVSYSNNPVTVKNSHSSALRVNIDVDPTASVGEYTLKVPLTDGNSANDQAIYLTLQIIYANSGSNVAGTTSFVTVLGYANFVITYAGNASTPSPSLDNNTIYAYAVSDIEPSPVDLTQGRAPRLLPWR